MNNIEIQYPTWLIIGCLVLGALVSGVLYYKSNYFPGVKTWWKVLLALFRFLATTVISLLLLSPVIKTSRNDTRNPVVVIAQDVSASIRSETDSMVLSQYQQDLQTLANRFSTKYDLRTFSFGEGYREGLESGFQDQSSQLSGVLDHIYDLYGDQNLGAVIFASDGIFNEGTDPRYISSAQSAPLYTVALGDTTPDRDVSIIQVFHNNIAYLGDKTAIQVDVSAYNCSGEKSQLQLYRVSGNGQVLLQSVPVLINRPDFFQTYELNISQDVAGLQRFRLVLQGLSGEKSGSNNRKDFFIEIIDARQKILLIANSPHPDIAAIRSVFEKNKNYEVEFSVAQQFKGNLGDFSFIVLHQLPSRGNTATNTLLREIKNRKIPTMLITGYQTTFPAFNQWQRILEIKPKTGDFNNAQAVFNPAFSFYRLSEDLQQRLAVFPPLDAPFADYTILPGAEVLLYQRLGKIDTEFPLLLVGEEEGIKSAILCGEGLWRWKLFDHLQHGNNEIFDELISKTVQYVTLKEDKRKFRVFQNKNVLAENEDVLFDAELYNKSYQLVNEPEVNITLYNSKKEAFEFVFSRRNQGYILNAGRLPADDYQWTANTQFEGQSHNLSGQFSIQNIEKESYITVANHTVLKQLSEKSGGEMIYPDQVLQLEEILEDRNELKPVLFQVIQTRSAINIKTLFFFMLTLLSLEWALRRYLGSY